MTVSFVLGLNLPGGVEWLRCFRRRRMSKAARGVFTVGREPICLVYRSTSKAIHCCANEDREGPEVHGAWLIAVAGRLP